MSLELVVSIVGVVVSILGVVATIITVLMANKQVNNDTKRRIDDENRERIRFETETKMTLESHTKDISELKSDVKSLRTDVNSIKNELSEFRGKFDAFLIDKEYSTMSKRKSPRQLTEVGQQVFDEIVGNEFFETHKKLFLDLIKERDPQTALDVEKDALNVVLSKVSDPMFNEIKNKVYNYPSITLENGETFTVEMSSVCIAISIPLRDEYLRLHPELNA